jgi:2-methylcitrate dehydratase PrpD
MAGSGAPGAAGVRAAAASWGGGAHRPLGCPASEPGLSPASLAFVDGFQIHCLEWDAVHEPAVVHALSVVTAAVRATALARGGVDPDEALRALVVGVEIACALGVAATGPLRFFRPAVAGLMGASLAAARIAGIAPDRFDDVLGLAHAQSAGTMQAHLEGSIALPVQIAHAARAAVTAVDLVANGLSGPHDPLEGPFGHFALFDEGTLASVAGTLGVGWRVLEISIKPWPCGRASHATLGALAGQTGAGLLGIEARVPPLVARLVGRPWLDDMTPAYARLCLPFLVALLLQDGRIDPRRFVPGVFGDPALRALGARLTLVDDGNPDPNALGPQAFRLRLSGGGVLELAVADALGSPGNPLTGAGYQPKAQLAAELAGALTSPSLSLLAGQS